MLLATEAIHFLHMKQADVSGKKPLAKDCCVFPDAGGTFKFGIQVVRSRILFESR